MGKGKNRKAKKKQDNDILNFLDDEIKKNNELSQTIKPKSTNTNNKKNKRKINLDKKYLGYPNVSICTPTFNRRPFFEGLIRCIKAQDYPHYKIEWIIVDDGTDCVRDIFEDENFIESMGSIKIRYFYEKEKMDLGKKRNYMHEKCEFKNDDDVIVYMDDDDFYPPQRVSHSVERLVKNPKALCGGSSEIYLWFNTLDKMYKFGPYGPNHATAGTFAFRRKLLKDTSYENEAVLAEEKHFLKNYTVPFVQFDPLKTILVFSHEQNTFDKRRLINKENKFCKESDHRVHDFIDNRELQDFYKIKIGEMLKSYEPGDVKNKPKVLKEIERRDKERQNMTQMRPSGIFVTDQRTGQSKELNMQELMQHMQNKDKECVFLHHKLNELMKENKMLKEKIQSLENDKNEIKVLDLSSDSENTFVNITNQDISNAET